MMELKGLQHLALLHLDDVIAEGGLHDARHLTGLQGIGGILELLDQLSALHKRQQPALLGRARILRHFLGQFGKIGTVLQCLIHRVGTQLGGRQLLGCGLLIHAQQDMRRLNQAVGTDALHRLVIYLMRLGLHIGVGHHQRQHLLVTILCKLVLERLQRVVPCLQGCHHLQFIVDEQIYILLDRLLVDYALRVVLIVGILKLRTEYRRTVHRHDHGIGSCLRHCGHPHEQGSRKHFQSHCCCLVVRS